MSTPDLASYHVVLVNISGGKDSQAALQHAYGVPPSLTLRDR